jgi:tight adherence protein B
MTRRAPAKALLALVAVATVVVGFAAPAFADALTIRKVDTTAFPKVKVAAQIDGNAPALGSFTLRENQQFVNGFEVVPLAQANTEIGVVLLIDISGSMRANGKLDAAKAAADQFVDQKAANESVAVVVFNDQARVASNFTKDPNLLKGVINGLSASGETALWDGVRQASGLFNDRPDLQANIVLLSDGKDTVSQTTNGGQARAAVQSAKASVFAVGLRGGADFDAGALQGLANASGGQYAEASQPGGLAALYAQAQRALQNQYEITYTSKSTTGVVELTLAAGGLKADASAPVGGVSRQSSSAQPKVLKPVAVPGFLAGAAGKLLIALLVLIAVGLAGTATVLLLVRDPSSLDAALRPYSDAPADDESDDEISERVLAESAFLKRAVEATTRMAQERGVVDRIERKLEQADLALRPAEFLFFWVAIAVVLVIAGAVVGKFAGLIFTVIVFGFGPLAFLNAKAARRRVKFTSQLPDTLQMLSSTLRAGYSLMQAVDAVAAEADEPIAKELRRVLVESRLGRPLEEALEDSAARMESPDFEWAVMAVGIQREVGGNLAELLDTVKETMTQRERLRGEIKSLTAEGKISAIVLAILPIGLGAFMWSVNKEYMQPLFHDSLGQIMLGGALVAALVGFFWMKKTIEIEV